MAYLTVTIYGSDSDIRELGRTVKMPNLIDVQAIATTTFTLDVIAVDAEPKIDSTTTKKWDGSVFIQNKVLFSAKPTGVSELYEIADSFESYFGTDTIGKTYKWVHIPNYALMPSGYDNTKAIAINIESVAVEHDHKSGTKTKTFNIVER